MNAKDALKTYLGSIESNAFVIKKLVEGLHDMADDERIDDYVCYEATQRLKEKGLISALVKVQGWLNEEIKVLELEHEK